MKDTIYFRHDYNARNDVKIIKLLQKHGWAGYGMFWALIELMREQADGKLKLSDTDTIAYSLRIDTETASTFISDCIESGLFKKYGELFWSPRLIFDMEAMHEKAGKAKKAAAKRWKACNSTDDQQDTDKTDANAYANAMQTHSERNADAMPKSIVEYSIVEESIEKKKKDSIEEDSRIEDDPDFAWDDSELELIRLFRDSPVEKKYLAYEEGGMTYYAYSLSELNPGAILVGLDPETESIKHALRG